ncbi:hypothetical protein [Microseira wollei]|uniref:Uncharacterized protein n=1 Tax=Microseira wollei NIES-4236 TaxID=2530354 RepID=A0AAV3WLM1_9CYAN|nr:hypothetical protein [Microseira wollei]GET41979.1 hypothetical protein MiSe_67930 [Microseira wollei NIES-4236]
MNRQEQFGRDLRSFLIGFLGDKASSSESETTKYPGGSTYPTGPSSGYNDESQRYIKPPKPGLPDLVAAINVGARLTSGHLLLGVQKDRSIYTYDPNSGEAEIVCSFLNTKMTPWRVIIDTNSAIYVCMSGEHQTNKNNSYEILWGQIGALVKIETRKETMSIIPVNVRLQDPSHIILKENGNLLVVDFQGFGGTGSLYEVNPSSGESITIATQGVLRDPISAVIGADGYIYVANSYQTYDTPLGNDGRFQKNWGNVVRVDPKNQSMEIIYDESNIRKGVICGIVKTDNPNCLIVIRVDWPAHTEGAVLLLYLTTRKVEPLLEASKDLPRFIAHQAVTCINGKLLVADSYQKELLTIDMHSKEIISVKSMMNILGSTRGMIHSMQTIESMVVIP